MLSSGSFFIFLLDLCGNSVEGNRERSTLNLHWEFPILSVAGRDIELRFWYWCCANIFVSLLQRQSHRFHYKWGQPLYLHLLSVHLPKHLSKICQVKFFCVIERTGTDSTKQPEKNKENFKWSEMNLWAAGQCFQRDAVIAHRVWKWTGQ